VSSAARRSENLRRGRKGKPATRPWGGRSNRHDPCAALEHPCEARPPAHPWGRLGGSRFVQYQSITEHRGRGKREMGEGGKSGGGFCRAGKQWKNRGEYGSFGSAGIFRLTRGVDGSWLGWFRMGHFAEQRGEPLRMIDGRRAAVIGVGGVSSAVNARTSWSDGTWKAESEPLMLERPSVGAARRADAHELWRRNRPGGYVFWRD